LGGRPAILAALWAGMLLLLFVPMHVKKLQQQALPLSMCLGHSLARRHMSPSDPFVPARLQILQKREGERKKGRRREREKEKGREGEGEREKGGGRGGERESEVVRLRLVEDRLPFPVSGSCLSRAGPSSEKDARGKSPGCRT